MTKEILLVYQDCPMCGARQEWGERQTKVANDFGFKIRNVPFTSDEGRDLIKKVCLHHELIPKKDDSLATLPFFTDGKFFSKNLEDFVETEPEPDESEVEEKPKRRKKSRAKESAEVIEDGNTKDNA